MSAEDSERLGAELLKCWRTRERHLALLHQHIEFLAATFKINESLLRVYEQAGNVTPEHREYGCSLLRTFGFVTKHKEHLLLLVS
jgi:hypothetical protein